MQATVVQFLVRCYTVIGLSSSLGYASYRSCKRVCSLQSFCFVQSYSPTENKVTAREARPQSMVSLTHSPTSCRSGVCGSDHLPQRQVCIPNRIKQLAESTCMLMSEWCSCTHVAYPWLLAGFCKSQQKS